MQNRLCFTRKQTCNGEYTKHCTRSRYQLKMAAPAEVSERRSNFRIRQFLEKRLFNIAANLTHDGIFRYTSNCAYCQNNVFGQTYRHTHTRTHARTHTHTRDNYCNPLCACAPRVNWRASEASEPLSYHVN